MLGSVVTVGTSWAGGNPKREFQVWHMQHPSVFLRSTVFATRESARYSGGTTANGNRLDKSIQKVTKENITKQCESESKSRTFEDSSTCSNDHSSSSTSLSAADLDSSSED